jgi:hypothetical protein
MWISSNQWGMQLRVADVVVAYAAHVRNRQFSLKKTRIFQSVEYMRTKFNRHCCAKVLF